MPPLLDVRGLTVELLTPSGEIRPVHDVSFSLQPAEAAGLVGESGSGKTMLGLALLGLVPPRARRCGQVWLAGRDGAPPVDLVALDEPELRRVRGREIGIVFQEPMTALDPVMRVGTQVAEAARVHRPGLGSGPAHRLALAALERAAIPDPPLRARQFPHQLSGGLRQRAMIAMALAADPRMLIADEPTTALDVTVQRQILELLSRLRRDAALAMLFVSHDLAVVAQAVDRLLVMYAGRIVESGPASTVLANPRHPYTEGLLRAAPQRGRRLAPIPGSVPRLDALPPGCSFEPRCLYRQPECSVAVPEPRRAGPDHFARCILVR
ncbi:MAG TPA: ABC transporter ATP-binding protein [Candidatus Acidoferrales bacterium]|nr:ABC transporter ATP-binding protein [Candidatus Acidoferrales bacterium]